MQKQEVDPESQKESQVIKKRDPRYWVSLEEYQQDPSFFAAMEQEFQSSPLREEEGDDAPGWARREFLKLMGASVALASSGCVRRPVQKIVPYNKRPEEITLGQPNFYSSTYFNGEELLGVLVKSREGRPIKIESHPNHPFSRGGLSARAQGSLLSLYDPDRLRGPKRNLLNEARTNRETVHVSWADLDSQVVQQLKKGDAVLLSGPVASPSLRALMGDFCSAFGVKQISWGVGSNSDVLKGQRVCYGSSILPVPRFDRAKIILSVDGDFLGTWMSPTSQNSNFASGRKNLPEMSRLISFDSTYSLTAANSDLRFAIKPSEQLWVVMGLLHTLVVSMGKSRFAQNTELVSKLKPYAKAWQVFGVEEERWMEIAQQLWESQEKALVVAGGIATQGAQSEELQIAVNLLNSILGADGYTVDYVNGRSADMASTADLLGLLEQMKKGEVKTLILHQCNPAYVFGDAFAEAAKKVEMLISTADRQDESSQLCQILAPDHHALENWGDVEFSSNLVSISQPSIRPMYETRAFGVTLMSWAALANKGKGRLLAHDNMYDFVRDYWRSEFFPKMKKGSDFEDFWEQSLQDGYAGVWKSSAGSPRSFLTSAIQKFSKPGNSSAVMELVLYPTVQLGMGELANVSWLQELPDPVTKIVWDNYLMVSPKTAESKSWKEGSMVEVATGGGKLTLPVHIQPGLHDEVAALAVGYGRTAVGKVGNHVGQNAFELVDWSKGGALSALSFDWKNVAGKYELACTQGHFAMEGRQIVVEATLEEYKKSPDANIHRHHVWSIWPGHAYNGRKWGMTIDLNSCTGCSACMTACQSENNIPVVGKRYVLQGREMHWIRVDRYYSGDSSAPTSVFHPVTCQHCDNAPCETVCPVMATAHSDEGLNDMSYNRCVGTRYCANNCPYKVRRFNWFNFTKNTEKPLHMAYNPSVGVRTRGVMEKCTFCVHRIHEAKNVARNENRELRDGDVKTACQTACPTSAIIFGDLNDENSKVAQVYKKDPRAYALLEEWNAAPSVRYLSKIRNTDQKGKHS